MLDRVLRVATGFREAEELDRREIAALSFEERVSLVEQLSSSLNYGEVSSYTATQSGTTVYAVTYLRDNFGRITSKSESIAAVGSLGATTSTTCYGYDALNRLTTVKTAAYTDTTCASPTATTTYLYDAYSPATTSGTGNGNRTQVSGANVCPSPPCYDAQDRLIAYGGTAYSFSHRGDLTSTTTSGQTTSYTYDTLSNLTSVALPSKTLNYNVDGQNRRVGKLTGSTFTQGFLYRDDLRPFAELGASGNVVRLYAYGTRPNSPDLVIEPGGNVYRVVTDQVGSPRLVVNVSTGKIVERTDYDEFGNVTAHALVNHSDGAYTRLPFGFAGGLADWDTGLLRFGARDYDPVTGRWTTKDPIRFEGGLNLYEYAAGDPINGGDETGEITTRSDCQAYATAVFVGCGLVCAAQKNPFCGAACFGGWVVALRLCERFPRKAPPPDDFVDCPGSGSQGAAGG